MEELPILSTSRLLLRAYTKTDWVEFHQLVTDPDVTRLMGYSPPENEAESRGQLDYFISGPNRNPPSYFFAVISQSTNKLIGGCSLTSRPNEAQQRELTYLLNRQSWGQGYATEAAQAVLQFGFEQVGLHRIYATARPENQGSYRVLEKLDMQREGHLRQHLWKNGKWWDSFLYAALGKEWRSKLGAN